MIIVSDEDDDSEIKTAAPIAVGRDEEGLGQFGIRLADFALGVGDNGTLCCEDDGLNKTMI